jgi:hypothetical protein
VGVTKLYDLCTAVLAAVVAGWPDDATPLPERRYVSDGAVVWDDCEQLSVSIDRTFTAVEGDPTGEGFSASPSLMAMRVAHVNVGLLRCVPDIVQQGTNFYAPKDEDVAAAAAVILTDAQALTQVIVGMALTACGSISFEGWAAAGPEAGMGGGVAAARMMLL